MKLNPEWLFGIKRDVCKYDIVGNDGEDSPWKYWLRGDFRGRMEGFLDTEKHRNYAIDKFAEKHRLDQLPGVTFDSESSCTYIYFDVLLAAQRFVREWNAAVQREVTGKVPWNKVDKYPERYVRYTLQELATPKDHHTTRCGQYWCLDQDGKAVVYVLGHAVSPQCHGTKRLAEALSRRLYSGKVIQVPVAYVPQYLPKALQVKYE